MRRVTASATVTPNEATPSQIKFDAVSQFLQAGTGAVTRIQQDKLRDIVCVLDYIPVAEIAAISARTSSTNVTAYIQDAVDYVAGLGGGMVYAPTGTYNVSGLVMKTGVTLQGDGLEATIFLQPTNGNADVILTENAYSLFGTDNNDITTPHDFKIRDLQVDGNGANQSGSGTDSINGLALYGYHYVLSGLLVKNAKRHGIRAEWGPFGEWPMEPYIDNVTIDTCGRQGFWYKGPHDGDFHRLTVIDAGAETDNTYDGLLVEGNSNGRFFNYHGWHRSTATNRVASQMRDSAGSCEFIGCHFEGGRRQVRLQGGNTRIVGSNIYAHFGSTDSEMMEIESNDNQISATKFAGSNGDYYAVRIGTAAGTARSANIIEGIFDGFDDKTPFNFGSDGGNLIRARGFCNSGGATAFGGTLSPLSEIVYLQGGTVIDEQQRATALKSTIRTDSASVIASILEGDRATPTAFDQVQQVWRLSSSAGVQRDMARQIAQSTDVTNGAESARIGWGTISGGTIVERMFLQSDSLFPNTSAAMSLGLDSRRWTAMACQYLMPTATPAALTGTSGSVAASASTTIINPSGTFTLTLPAAASFPGRMLWLKNIAAQLVNSASSNVIPKLGGSASTPILPATAGAWAMLVSNGTSWEIMMSGT